MSVPTALVTTLSWTAPGPQLGAALRPQAQAVSNTAWALATLVYLPEGDLLTELAVRATAIIRTFRPQATSNTL